MKKNKFQRKNNYKKIFVSYFALFSLVSTVAISQISNINKNSISNNFITARNVSTNSSAFTSPSADDLYNDYACINGFVTINDSSINFSNWFGFGLWKFDVNANVANLFGDSGLSVKSLKVKASIDKTQIYVYGYFTNDSSFLFKLNAMDGTIDSIGTTKSYSTDLIKDVNLLTIVNNTAILTQKTPIGSSSYSISTSEIDLQTGQLTNVSYDITGSKSDRQVVSFGEIIGVQKVNTNYIFDIKAIVHDGNQYHPSLLMINEINNGSGKGTYASNAYSCSFWGNVNSPNSINLDNVNFCILNIDNTSTQTTYITAKYSTTPTSNGSGSNTTTFNRVYYTTLDSSHAGVNYAPITISNVTNSQSTDSVAGVTNFLYNSVTKTPYVVLANGGSNSKIAISTLSTSSIGAAPGWIDLSNCINTSDYQSINVNFVPDTTVTQTSSIAGSVVSGYSGYIDVQKYTSADATTYSDSRSFFSINTALTTITPIADYSLGMSDSAIDNKYKAGKASASENTVNKLVADLTKVEQNGKTLNVPYVNNITLDLKDQTIKGDVVLTLNNWWNSGTSQLTRSVDINLTTIGVIVYTSIALAIVVVLAIVLVLTKVFLINKKLPNIIKNPYKFDKKKTIKDKK